MSDSPQRKTLEEINSQYREQVPEDLRGSHSFDWYLDEVYESPEVTRNAHQRVADMFEYFGTEYDEETGIVEYKLATEDPLHDGENVFFGENVHEAIHDFVNKVYSGSRGLGPEKRIKLLLARSVRVSRTSIRWCENTLKNTLVGMLAECIRSAGPIFAT